MLWGKRSMYSGAGLVLDVLIAQCGHQVVYTDAAYLAVYTVTVYSVILILLLLPTMTTDQKHSCPLPVQAHATTPVGR